MPIQLSTDFMLPFRGRYYFAAIFGNGVFSYDFKRENLRLEFRFPYPMQSFRLYKDILLWDDWLIFVPCNAPDIAIYHVDTGKLELLPIPERKPRRKTWCQDGYHFWTGVRKGDRAYLVGQGYPGILCLDLPSKNIEILDDWVNMVERRVHNKNNQPYGSEGIVRGDIAYFPLCCLDALLKLDSRTNETSVMPMHTGIRGFNGITDDGERLWITPRFFDDLLLYRPDTGEKKKIKLRHLYHGKPRGEVPYFRPIPFGENMILPPIFASGFTVINRQTLKAVNWDRGEHDAPRVLLQPGTQDVVDCPMLLQNGALVYQEVASGIWHILDKAENQSFSMCMPAEDREVFARDFLKRNSVLNESEEFRLTEFLSLVDGLHEMKDSRKQLKSSGDGSLLRETNGQKIWRCICNGGE